MLAKTKYNIFLLGNGIAKINQLARENPSINFSPTFGSTKRKHLKAEH